MRGGCSALVASDMHGSGEVSCYSLALVLRLALLRKSSQAFEPIGGAQNGAVARFLDAQAMLHADFYAGVDSGLRSSYCNGAIASNASGNI